MKELQPIPAPARVMTGLWGEFLAAESLRDCGYAVTWLGGGTKHYDLLASRVGMPTLEVSVKASTRRDGFFAWSKPGNETVTPWASEAAARDHIGVFLLVHLADDAYSVRYLDDEDALLLPRPQVLAVTAMTVGEWGIRVDEARRAYGQKVRRYDSKHGHKAGDLLGENGLLYPVSVSQGQTLAEFLPAQVL